MKQHHFLAFDLGAESGRAVRGTLAEGRITLEVLHRFRTEGLIMLGTRQWDLARIYEEMLTGLSRNAAEHGPVLDGIGVDTWGVDFGLVARDGTVLGNPVAYRDRRTEGIHEIAFSMVPREEIYQQTGIQFMIINTVYQLLAMARAKSPLLEVADAMMLMGDLFHYTLCGKRSCEYTNASTSQMLDPWKRQWNDGLIEKLGLPRHLLLDLVPPGTVLGPVLPEVAQHTGIAPETPVITPATHDTACAVSAVPVIDASEPWAYICSGTWSLLGAEM